jgi:hypothetical protein
LEAPHPSYVKGEQDHGFALARAFMPLNTPISVRECEVTAEVDEEEPSFRQALRVFIGECSNHGLWSMCSPFVNDLAWSQMVPNQCQSQTKCKE